MEKIDPLLVEYVGTLTTLFLQLRPKAAVVFLWDKHREQLEWQASESGRSVVCQAPYTKFFAGRTPGEMAIGDYAAEDARRYARMLGRLTESGESGTLAEREPE